MPNFDMILQKDLFLEFTTDQPFLFHRGDVPCDAGAQRFEVLQCEASGTSTFLSAIVKKRIASICRGFTTFKYGALPNSTHTSVDSTTSRWPSGARTSGVGHHRLAEPGGGSSMSSIRPRSSKGNTPLPPTCRSYRLRHSSRSVEAVIVMAASYSDEVARILRQRSATAYKSPF